MWFYLGLQNFIAKKSFSIDSYDIFISDFIYIWHTTLTNNELISICQKLNPLLEASTQKLKEVTFSLFEDIKTKKEIKKENDTITLFLESSSRELQFRFQITLNRGNHEMFYQEFTIPLLMMLVHAQNKEKKLVKILEDKDQEITEYKQECGHLKSYFKVTKPFIKSEFDCEELTTTIPWDMSSFLDFINGKLLKAQILSNFIEVDESQHTLQETEGQCFKTEKCDKKLTVFNNKSLNEKISSKPCVTLGNQITKKRKHNNMLKLQF